MDRPAWAEALAVDAPDVVDAWWAIDEGRFLSVRRSIRARAGQGTAAAIVRQLDVLAWAFALTLQRLPPEALVEPGGEGDWNVAQTIGHAADARAGLAVAASVAAAGRWPADAGPVVPGVPGPAGASRDVLIRRIALSQRAVERAARRIAGHETDACPLEHPLVGRLRCGEWLMFAGVHDLMHLEQLHAIAGRFVVGAADGR
jgi:hypothetical protein